MKRTCQRDLAEGLPRRILQLQGAVGKGGAERHTAQLVVGLRQQFDRDVVLVGPYRNDPELADWLRARGVSWVEMDPTSRSRAGVSVLALTRLIRRHRIEMVHSHLRNADLLAGAAARLTGVPWITTFHGPTYLKERQGRIDAWALRRLHGHLLRTQCHGAIAVSRYVKQLCAAELELSAERIEVVYNGTDPARASRSAPSPWVQEELGLPPDAPVVLFVGELTPRKGPEHFVRAAAIVCTQIPRAHFVMVGEGRLRQQLARLARRFRVQARVHFVGRRRDVPRFMHSADVLLVPSYREGFGRVITEAMACARPVIAFGGAGPDEVIAHARTGYLVPSGDEGALAARCIEVLRSRHRRETLGQQGLERFGERFSMQRFIESTAEAIARLSAGRERDRRRAG